jgi:hypothetical protein
MPPAVLLSQLYIQLPDDPPVKIATYLVLASALTLVGCSGQEQPAPQQQSQAAEAPQAAPTPAPAARLPKPTSPERIAEIEASGKSGLWATVTDVCRKEIRSGVRTTLVWNVKDSGAKRVILYVVDANGSERNFGQGPSVGDRETGPWLRPGLTFRVRNYDTKDDLGSIVIGEKSC